MFADLGLPNPEQELLKARLMLRIYKMVKDRRLTQARASELLGIKQPHVAARSSNRELVLEPGDNRFLAAIHLTGLFDFRK